MKIKPKVVSLSILIFLLNFLFIQVCFSDQEIKLPLPQKEGGIPLMQALAKRSTQRNFSDKKLSDQTVSNLLWAANGINRPDSGKKTAPTAVNWQEIDVYLSNQDGLYLYKPKTHSLVLILKEDIRELTGEQPFVKDAPINLIYVNLRGIFQARLYPISVDYFQL